jgi:uncharacterized membrane protein YgcG
MSVKTTVIDALAAAVFAALAACSSSGSSPATHIDAGLVHPGPSCAAGAAGGLASFTAPADPGGGGVLFAASGEVLALSGYPFPPVNAGDPVFVDGWDVHFTRLLVTVDNVTVSSNPDMSKGDPSQTGGAVAGVKGPWAIDLSHSDPAYLPGKGGPGEEAVPIAALKGQNLVGGSPGFATDGTRYAFGFDLIAATTCTADGRQTLNVNIDTAGQADYQEMVQNGCAVLYVGTATFKGGTVPGYTGCNTDDAGVYQTWPQTVNFRLCFKSPTTYVNCQNPDNDPAKAFPNEEHQRGIAFKSSQSVIGQVTVHTDHPFWDSVLHDSPAHFDQFAARLAGQNGGGGASADGGAISEGGGGASDGGAISEGGASDGGVPTVTVELTKGVDYTAYTDALGHKVNWRYCIAPSTDVHPQFNGPMAFDPQGVPHCVGANSATGLCDYYDYSTYNQSTQGHLNSNGLCFVKRNYPSPP